MAHPQGAVESQPMLPVEYAMPELFAMRLHAISMMIDALFEH
jgi:hypothetical protein